MSEKLHCFAPLVDKNTKFLVIGTMPGEASLQAAEYYALSIMLFGRLYLSYPAKKRKITPKK